MFVRWVITAWAILLGIVPCAGLGHQHAAGTQTAADHDARPHIHLAGHHHHVGCDHSHEHQEADVPALRAEHDHDGDAVYLAGGAVQGVRVRASEPQDTGHSQTACLPSDVAASDVTLALAIDRGSGTGVDCFARCPLYLQVRALRL